MLVSGNEVNSLTGAGGAYRMVTRLKQKNKKRDKKKPSKNRAVARKSRGTEIHMEGGETSVGGGAASRLLAVRTRTNPAPLPSVNPTGGRSLWVWRGESLDGCGGPTERSRGGGGMDADGGTAFGFFWFWRRRWGGQSSVIKGGVRLRAPSGSGWGISCHAGGRKGGRRRSSVWDRGVGEGLFAFNCRNAWCCWV